jgi:hypothetical protein
MKQFLLFILLPTLGFAADFKTLAEEEINPDTEEVLIKKPEKYLRDESMIYDLNTDLGIKDQRRYTGSDSNKIGIAGHVSGDYERFNDILGFEFNYMHRTNSYSRLWYGFQLFQHNTYFDSITQNHTSASSNPNAEVNTPRPNNTKASVFAGGPGIGYRFKLLQEFFETEDVFETVDVFVNYLTFDDKYIKQKYQGYGLTTNYGIHKRSSTKYFYGGKLSYNLASVTRDAIGTEGKSDRSFALGWLSVGFELGFFF